MELPCDGLFAEAPSLSLIIVCIETSNLLSSSIGSNSRGLLPAGKFPSIKVTSCASSTSTSGESALALGDVHSHRDPNAFKSPKDLLAMRPLRVIPFHPLKLSQGQRSG
jgi:hypothetical protein